MHTHAANPYARMCHTQKQQQRNVWNIWRNICTETHTHTQRLGSRCAMICFVLCTYADVALDVRARVCVCVLVCGNMCTVSVPRTYVRVRTYWQRVHASRRRRRRWPAIRVQVACTRRTPTAPRAPHVYVCVSVHAHTPVSVYYMRVCVCKWVVRALAVYVCVFVCICVNLIDLLRPSSHHTLQHSSTATPHRTAHKPIYNFHMCAHVRTYRIHSACPYT